MNCKNMLISINVWDIYHHLLSEVSGHAQTKKMNEHGKEAIHSFQVMTRQSFEQHVTMPEGSWVCECGFHLTPLQPLLLVAILFVSFFSVLSFFSIFFPFCFFCHVGHQLQETMKDTPHPADVVLQFRHYVGSKEWCQDPMVLGSDHMFRSMEETPSNCAPRTRFSDRQIKEFNKTAEVISLAPWFLEAATAYLLKLVQDNIDGHSMDWIGPDVGFGLRFQRVPAEVLPSISSVPPEALMFANRNPAPVNVRIRGKSKPLAQKDAVEGEDEPELPDAELAPQDADPELPDAESEKPDETVPSDPELPDAVDRAAAPKSNPGAGAPAGARGRGGAPPGIVYMADQEVKKRPAAAPKAASKRKCLAKLPFPDGASEALQRIKDSGHTKCRNSKFGCQECRKKAGLVLNADESAWEWKT